MQMAQVMAQVMASHRDGLQTRMAQEGPLASSSRASRAQVPRWVPRWGARPRSVVVVLCNSAVRCHHADCGQQGSQWPRAAHCIRVAVPIVSCIRTASGLEDLRTEGVRVQTREARGSRRGLLAGEWRGSVGRGPQKRRARSCGRQWQEQAVAGRSRQDLYCIHRTNVFWDRVSNGD